MGVACYTTSPAPPPTINFDNSSWYMYLTSLQVLCAAAVNPVMFIEDNRNAVAVLKSSTPQPDAKPDNFSTSLVWVVSGATSITKVHNIHVTDIHVLT